MCFGACDFPGATMFRNKCLWGRAHLVRRADGVNFYKP